MPSSLWFMLRWIEIAYAKAERDSSRLSQVTTSCCAPPPPSADPRWRRALWIALVANLAMFGLEWIMGFEAQSRSLQADALDFLGDSANYAISLGVAGMALAWRARATLLKGATLTLLGGWVLASAVFALVNGTSPDPVAMGVIGVLALVVNTAVALMLYRFRDGDANMRSVWICSRNDAIGNIAVMIAALGVFGTGNGWPDIVVAAIMGTLALIAATSVIRQAVREIAPAIIPQPLPRDAICSQEASQTILQHRVSQRGAAVRGRSRNRRQAWRREDL